MPTPYSQHVGDRNPVEVLRSSLDDYRALSARLTGELWETPLAAGKWTSRQIMVHVAQWECILSVRLRCGLAMPGYEAQPLDQDPFMTIEGVAVSGPTALKAFEGLRCMNIELAEALSPEHRRTKIQHPERGTIDVEDLLVTLAGHSVHHVRQLQALTQSGPAGQKP